MGTGFSKKKKQAKEFQEQISQMQDRMQNLEVTGKAGNGLVTVTLTGDHAMKNILIKPDCVDPEDVEGLQDLIKAAYQDALKQLEKNSSQGMPKMPGGLPGGFPNIPGMPFGL